MKIRPDNVTAACRLLALVSALVFAAGVAQASGRATTEADRVESPADAAESSADTAEGEAATAPATTQSDGKKKPNKVTATYDKGLRIKSEDGNFAARIRWRAQMRLTDTSSSDLLGEEDGVQEEAGFLIRRARFKLDGHAYKPWLKYYLEYGIAASVMLTYELEVVKSEKVGFRVGQFKVPYNRERVDSSGKQQFVDRSIVNNPFTVDRQSGPNLQGRLWKGKRGDSKYNLGVYTGTGRGGGLDDDEEPMYVGRWQWNFLKRDLGFSQSDTKRRAKPAASFAVAAAQNTGRYTRFSSSGGGELPGFETPTQDESGRYRLEQWMAEFAYQGRGLSIQSEYHEKKIDDRVDRVTTELEGYYAQVGYFFGESVGWFPKPLEFALRVAKVNSTDGIQIPADREATLGANWFFSGHENKLTADVSYLKSTLAGSSSEDDGWRARLQWDITF